MFYTQVTCFKCVEQHFLLEFAYFGNVSGDVIRKKFDKMIEWDGRPSIVNRYRDYAIGYSENLIEVWDLRTSTRVQVMHGKDIRCIYDGGSVKTVSKSLDTLVVAKAVQQKPVDRIGSFESIQEIEALEDETTLTDENAIQRVLDLSCNSGDRLLVADKTPSSTFTQNYFETFHVSIQDSGNLYRVFEMGHIPH